MSVGLSVAPTNAEVMLFSLDCKLDGGTKNLMLGSKDREREREIR